MTVDPAPSSIRMQHFGHLDLDEQDATVDVSLVAGGPAEGALLQVTEGDDAAHVLLDEERAAWLILQLRKAFNV